MGGIFLWREILRGIQKNDPSIHSEKEALFHPWFAAYLWYRIGHFLYLKHWYCLARIVSNHAKRKTGIEIHPGAILGKGVFIDHGGGVVIGETAVAEEEVVIYQNVTLGGTGKEKGKRHPTIKKGAMIGAGAKILGNITIGEKAKIGANAVILKDVSSKETVVGIPGKVVKKN